MILSLHILSDLVGKIAHIRSDAVKYDDIYNYDKLLFFQNIHDCKMFFIFIEEQPYWKNNQ